MLKVLLVDDADLVLALQDTFLNRSNCRVSIAATAEEAWARTRAERPDLVVLDAGMAGGGGVACCQRIKRDPELEKTPVVLIFPSVDHPDYSKPGPDRVVCRPLSREHLVETLRTLIPGSVRTSARRDVTLRVAYFQGEQERVGYAQNIGAGGLFLKSREPFAPAERLALIFELPERDGPTIRAEGEVVRQIEPDRDSHLIAGVGLRFRRLGARDRRELALYVGGEG